MKYRCTMSLSLAVSILIWTVLGLSLIENAECLESTVNFLTLPTLLQANGYYNVEATDFGFGQCPFSSETQSCRVEADLYSIDTLLCENNIVNNTAMVQHILLEDDAPPLQFFLLMVNRGGCPFATKVRNAQYLNAALASAEIAGLVIATTDGSSCGEVDSVSSTLCSVELSGEYASDIYLPSVILAQQDADAVKREHQDSPFRMELTWQVVPVQTDTVVLDFWHLPSPYRTSGSQKDIPASLGQVVRPFSNQVRFTPKFYIVSAAELGCNANENECSDGCTNNGRYCVEDPENAFDQGVSGANLMEESLRRMCIWDLFGSNETDPIGVLWWNYMKVFHDTCTVESYGSLDDAPEFNKECSQAAMTEAGIDFMSVFRCVMTTGGTTEDRENVMLEANLLERQANAAAMPSIPPTLIVNGISFRGKSLSESFGAICASYTTDAVPDECGKCENCADDNSCLLNGGVCSSGPGGSQISAPTVAPDGLPNQDGSQIDEEISDPGGQSPGNTLQPPSSTTDNSGNSSAAPTDPLDGNEGETRSVDNNNTSDSVGDRLSDGTKMVIVVSVVGGAILVIFVFVVILVWKLFKRIRHLEGKGKETPTTTSPGGSGIWKLPHYVTTKEDPFNSEFEILPDAGIQSMPATATAVARKEERQPLPMTPAVDVTTATNVVLGEELKDNKAVETSRRPVVKRTSEQTSEVTVSTTSGSVSDDQSSAASKSRDEENSRRKGSVTPDRSKAKPRSKPKPKQSNSVQEIMGKSAPEAKIPKSFSFANEEEKEEIEEVVNESFRRT